MNESTLKALAEYVIGRVCSHVRYQTKQFLIEIQGF
jgi:hypothetical protein